MSSEEWSQELTFAWWTDACFVRVALCLREREDEACATSHPYCVKSTKQQLTFLRVSLREGEAEAWGLKRCLSWGYVAISFCRNTR